jgi:hypothetical protein
MYAISSPNDIYHLLTETKDQTLCGLPVGQVVIDRPTESSLLYLTSKRPDDRELCSKCAKIELDRVS